ncbi:hypothetical protein CYY_003994 [Polysphondylium violaceum]|uniref:Short-chain dehydrogenase/reductase family protein n=1 Tax=Polysphondylium violaceum TaxID=133409 RepID=A0A8J4PTZ0_9MYCE|nr:hypothetical protein CYY_003994 [Polysphondylium violaceum]
MLFSFLLTIFSTLCTAVGLIYVFYYIYFNVILLKLKTKSIESYKGKVVIVTGASSGIGSSIAEKYALLGCKVAIVARRENLLEECKSNILKKHKKLSQKDILIVRCDLTKENDCKEMVDKVIKEWSKLDIVVWNAGVGSLIDFSKVDGRFDIFRDNMDINYFSLVYSTSFALPFLKQSNGSIVVVSSLAGKFGTALRTSYSASKHAVQGFFNSLRNEVDNVQITIVCPGFVKTDFHSKVATLDNKVIERESNHFMTPQVCADHILEAERMGKRELIMTPKARIGSKLTAFFPEFIDYMTNLTAKSSIKK